jgi:DNA-binding NarL/FixJ family response regulator
MKNAITNKDNLSNYGRNKSPEEKKGKFRIMVVDDHPLMRQALLTLLERYPEFKVVAQASDGQEAVNIVENTDPDIIIMDISMPGLNGLEATRQIKAKHPNIAILILTVHSDNEHIYNIIKVGACGYLVKTASDEEIINALHSVAAGDTVLSPDVSTQIFKYIYPIKPPSGTNLTVRELEILKLVAKGISNKEIAGILAISPRSVTGYLTNVFNKLNVASRTEAIAYSIQNGILTVYDLNPMNKS